MHRHRPARQSRRLRLTGLYGVNGGASSVVATLAAPNHYEALARLALFYRSHLAKLCGLVVPQFFRLFRSDDWSLLVLEDTGEIVHRSGDWGDLSEQERCWPSDCPCVHQRKTYSLIFLPFCTQGRHLRRCPRDPQGRIARGIHHGHQTRSSDAHRRIYECRTRMQR
jgi:hypothetical protein